MIDSLRAVTKVTTMAPLLPRASRERGKPTTQRRGAPSGQRKRDASHPNEKEGGSALRIRPFCTQQCLLRLAYGGYLDGGVPIFEVTKMTTYCRAPSFLLCASNSPMIVVAVLIASRSI
jgi:hypothetical protein